MDQPGILLVRSLPLFGDPMPVNKEILDAIALTEGEYGLIVKRLGREPNPVELGMFGALWSEHCGYKHSRPMLRLFPSSGPSVLLPPGEENAGAVDIGGGLAVVFKIESHNHPSAVEPYQGAATGVGGIVRDIMAMGAKPIALLNSLRFGPLEDPLNRYLFNGVVAGISWYGNCIGVPDVGGEICFSPCYSQNPLVNALCVGLIDSEKLIRSSLGSEGNIVLLVGAETGKDGIHGASGLASRTFEGAREMRPTVQVANPFLEKILIEACLEAAATGCLEGMQDLGAAGLSTAAVEAAARGKVGVDLDISKVHRRDRGMVPYEVMLSESQERMLLVINRGHKSEVESIFRKWDIPCAEIGRVTNTGETTVHDGPTPVAQLPVNLLADPPSYRTRGVKPRAQVELQRYPLGSIPLPNAGPASILVRLLGSPNLASREPVYRQYDHQVQTNTVVAPGGDAAVLRIKGTLKGIALCTDGNGRYCFLGPLPRRGHCRGRSLPESLLYRGPAHCPYRLPQLWRSGAHRDLLPAGVVHQRHGSSLPHLGRPCSKRQCEPIQRDPGSAYISHPGGRRTGPTGGRAASHHHGIQRRRGTGGASWGRRGKGQAARPGRQRVPGACP